MAKMTFLRGACSLVDWSVEWVNDLLEGVNEQLVEYRLAKLSRYLDNQSEERLSGLARSSSSKWAANTSAYRDDSFDYLPTETTVPPAICLLRFGINTVLPRQPQPLRKDSLPRHVTLITCPTLDLPFESLTRCAMRDD